jgi:hypothetical protein
MIRQPSKQKSVPFSGRSCTNGIIVAASLRGPAYAVAPKQKSLTFLQGFRIVIVLWRLPTLPGLIQVSSAVPGLTSLFGMGRGEHRANSHQQDLLS